jgi:hypothetical protein
LYSCDFDDAPEYLTDPGVEVVGEITHTMTEPELEQFEIKNTTQGLPRRMVKYDRQVLLGAREGTLKFKVTWKGKELGSTTVAYDSFSCNIKTMKP